MIQHGLLTGGERKMSTQKAAIAIIFTGELVCAHAQWLNHPSPGTPRTRDGKANLAAKAPRASNGKPDLSGVWQTAPAPLGENERLFGDVFAYAVVPGDDPRTFSKYFFNILADFKPEEAPIRPVAAELTRKNAENARANPSARCLPQGIVRADVLSYNPFKIIQTPGLTAILYEADNMFRQVYTDGRQLPVDPEPAWLGYSVGKWEGIRWWSIQRDSTTGAGLTPAGILIAKTCGFKNDSTAAISAIWT
jgi:hypothetical protein